MLLVLGMAAMLWGIGMVMGVSRQARLTLMGGLLALVLLLQFALPDGHPVREATGQSPALWLILTGAVVLVLGYSRFIRALRARSTPETAKQTPKPTGSFTDTELERYARHIVLRELGGPGQKRLKQARVLVIGAGGLGAPALQYLAAVGVGTIGVIDDDVVENANLQRQVIHRDADIGVPKVFSAKMAMEAQNPNVTVRPYNRRLTADIAAELFADYDLILDGTDNFETRYLANETAVKLGKPLISGALAQWEGQLSVFHPADTGPCYQCIFPEAPPPGLAPSCSEAGVIGPLPGVVGSMMAVEAVKLITQAGAVLKGEMLIYDALYGESRKITLSKRADCPVCGTNVA
ncbi:HesA/MoeB/ThiF family protein [Falsiruegeria mediterranea]|uniref:Molybdopterin-synthase adenylyltransferase n=1 Tax=Falsiruegeria mediterranea M17 TaxID=1200281 RepID=A0A2R8C671_9RHOB|nr:molybdopterin-synthase adenylyltransferase MoeB [Falsiruegeria mediterranea]SPJ27920.1 putative adenylyltransferase/sulfurtransferase MoeZ [Falsiruegeria mediterranea M17]